MKLYTFGLHAFAEAVHRRAMLSFTRSASQSPLASSEPAQFTGFGARMAFVPLMRMARMTQRRRVLGQRQNCWK
jgi:hypothetical protein